MNYYISIVIFIVSVCKLHVALHGCLQGYHYVSNIFTTYAGYNDIAEHNNVIILYPQVRNSILNPDGCWDW